MLFLHSPCMSSSTTIQRNIHMGACPVHHTPEYSQLQHFVASWMFSRTEFLLAGDPTCSSHQQTWKLKPKPCSEERADPRNMGTWATPSQPCDLTLKVPLLHFHNTAQPLIQIRYSWKQYYSSKATAIIFAMTAEKERHHCPKAMFCCSKNDERSPRGGKVWLSWPCYRYSLSIWHTNNALLVEKGRHGELYLNFTMFTQITNVCYSTENYPHLLVQALNF